MIRTTEDFIRCLKAARRVSTPLLAVRTPDPASAVQLIHQAVNGKCGTTAVLAWDVMRGVYGANAEGKAEIDRIAEGREAATVGPADVLAIVAQAREDTLLFYSSAHRFWNDSAVAQAIWNMRDGFKSNGCMLVLLSPPGSVLPPELSSDVLVLDEPLPSNEALGRIVKETFKAAELAEPTHDVEQKAVDALLGLAAFPAEQVLAMSLSPKRGLDAEQLWERKRQVIEQTPGLAVWRGGESFDDIGGCENVKTFLRAVIGGAEPPRVIVFVDEIEKAFAGTGTDLSGVKTEMTGTMLSWMQDEGADGCIFIGPPGAAKSAMAKATGNTAGIPTIAFDLAAMQSSLVGGSGERLRAALQVVEAVSKGQSLWTATSNSIGTLPPELRRRFTLGTFFFDLPSAEEREAIWRIYLAKYAVGGDLPQDDGWTGAEIKECCRKAYRLKISLKDSAQYIVPVSRSAVDQIKNLRQQASGKFISASHTGVYQFQEIATAARTGRAFRSTEG